MKKRFASFLLLAGSATGLHATAISVDLGSADSFAVLAGTTVTNSGSSTINGNLGVWPGTAVTGFPPGIVTTGTIHAGDTFAQQAQADLTTAYNFAAGEACPAANVLSGDIGGMTLTPGVYCSTSSLAITGTLTLDALGDPNAVFVIQMVSSLTTATNSSVVITNGGTGDSVFWQVGSSAGIGTGSAFAGNILALTSITMGTGASINCGRALAGNGAVTLLTNNISIDTTGCEAGAPTSGVPEPASLALSGFGLLGLMLVAHRWKSTRNLRKTSAV